MHEPRIDDRSGVRDLDLSARPSRSDPRLINILIPSSGN